MNLITTAISTNNLLPSYDKFEEVKKSSLLEWKPQASNSFIATLSSGHDRKLKSNSLKPHYIGPPPNHIDNKSPYQNILSPIGISERGLLDISSNNNNSSSDSKKVILPFRKKRKSGFSLKRRTSPSSIDSNSNLITNLSSSIIDVFHLTCNGIESKSLKSRQSFLFPVKTEPFDSSSNIMIISSLKGSAVIMSSDDEVRCLSFSSASQLGIVAEAVGDKVICSGVLKNSQAHCMYGDSIIGASIIAVNDEYVWSIESFQQWIDQFHAHDQILITFLISSENSSHLHHQYSQFPTNMRTYLKSAISNFLDNGIYSPDSNEMEGAKRNSTFVDVDVNMDANIENNNKNERINDNIKSDNQNHESDGLLAPIVNKREEDYSILVNQKTETKATWNFPTFIDVSRSLTYLKLIGSQYNSVRSQVLSNSEGFRGNFRISNYLKYQLIIYWIDQDGCFVFRQKLQSGEKYIGQWLNLDYWMIRVLQDDDKDMNSFKVIGDSNDVLDNSDILLFKLNYNQNQISQEYIWSPKKSISISNRIRQKNSNSKASLGFNSDISYEFRIIG